MVYVLPRSIWARFQPTWFWNKWDWGTGLIFSPNLMDNNSGSLNSFSRAVLHHPSHSSVNLQHALSSKTFQSWQEWWWSRSWWSKWSSYFEHLLEIGNQALVVYIPFLIEARPAIKEGTWKSWDWKVKASLKKMTEETPDVHSDKRKPRMLLRHRTS